MRVLLEKVAVEGITTCVRSETPPHHVSPLMLALTPMCVVHVSNVTLA